MLCSACCDFSLCVMHVHGVLAAWAGLFPPKLAEGVGEEVAREEPPSMALQNGFSKLQRQRVQCCPTQAEPWAGSLCAEPSSPWLQGARLRSCMHLLLCEDGRDDTHQHRCAFCVHLQSSRLQGPPSGQRVTASQMQCLAPAHSTCTHSAICHLHEQHVRQHAHSTRGSSCAGS